MKKLIPVFLLSFVNVIGFSLLIPVLPEVLIFYTGESSGLLYGLLLSSYAFCQFLAAPILGKLSDRFGRRPLLILSQLGTLLSWFVFAAAYFIPNEFKIGGMSVGLLVIFLSRIMDGATGGNNSVAQAWVSDSTKAKERTKAFGLMGATFGLGFLLGPAIGGFSVSTDIHFLGTAIFAILLSAFTLGFVIFGLPESLPKSKRSKESKISLLEQFNFFKTFALFRNNPVIKNLFWVRIFFALAFVGFTTAVILLLARTYSLTPIQVGGLMSIIGLFSVFNQAYLVPKCGKRFGDFNSFFGGIVLTSLTLGLHAALPVFFPPVLEGAVILLFLALSFFLNLGLSLVMTMFKTIISKQTTEDQQGEAMGLDESISSLGSAASPLFAGVLYDIIAAWSFALYGVALFLVSVRAFFRCRRKS